jgi:hypothetical protein
MANPNPEYRQFCLDAEIVRQVGWMPAFVHAILVAHYDSDGTIVMTQERIAKAGDISVRSVKRGVKALSDAGRIKVEHLYLDNRRQASRYQIVTSPGGGKPPVKGKGQIGQVNGKGQIGPANSSYLLVDESVDHSLDESFLERKKKEENTHPPSITQRPSAGVEPGPGLTPSGSQGGGGQESEPVSFWVPVGTPMPGPLAPGSSGMAVLAHHHEEAQWLVMFFEQLVLARDNREALRLGGKRKTPVTEKRRQGWFRSALTLLENHSLVEAAEVCDRVFAHSGGELPEEVKLSPAAHLPQECLARLKAEGKPIPRPVRRVTNLRQIFFYFDQLIEWMRRPRTCPRPGDEDQSADTGGRQAKTTQPFTEAQVGELVEAFAEFRGLPGLWPPPAEDDDAPVDRAEQFRRNNWAKTFTIMLRHDGRRFEDVKTVITSLRAYQAYIDIGRYHHPFHLREEFDQVLALVVQLTEAHAHRFDPPVVTMPVSLPRPRFYDDEDDERPSHLTDSGVANMADNLEERRARYAARAAKKRGTA